MRHLEEAGAYHRQERAEVRLDLGLDLDLDLDLDRQEETEVHLGLGLDLEEAGNHYHQQGAFADLDHPLAL